jgi:prevent-host-death family protein
MTNLTAAKAREHLAEILNQVAYGKERVVVTRRGKKLAAVVSMEDLEILQALEDKIDLKDARSRLAAAKKSKTIPWAKVKSEFRNK